MCLNVCCATAQTGSITLCSAHAKKGDLKAHDGLTAEQEEYQERAARAQLAAIVFKDPSRYRYFSKQLLKFADPHFHPSPREQDPSWRRSTKKPRPAQARKKLPPTAPSEASDEEAEKSRDLADMAAFWEDEDEDQ